MQRDGVLVIITGLNNLIYVTCKQQKSVASEQKGVKLADGFVLFVQKMLLRFARDQGELSPAGGEVLGSFCSDVR